jgi:purine-binding chemotaxis protein CheW
MSAMINKAGQPDARTHGASGKHLTFVLGAEEYGVPVLQVREIIKMMDITSVPQVPSHVRGVINLRRKVIPVVDLRMKFGLGSHEYTERTCIVVVEVVLRDTKIMMGAIVDAVSEVLNITPQEIEDTPEFGDQIQTSYLRGVAKVKGKVKILLDLDRVLGGDGAAMAA